MLILWWERTLPVHASSDGDPVLGCRTIVSYNWCRSWPAIHGRAQKRVRKSFIFISEIRSHAQWIDHNCSIRSYGQTTGNRRDWSLTRFCVKLTVADVEAVLVVKCGAYRNYRIADESRLEK